MSRPLRVLALTTYPEYAAATRYRVLQYVPLLRDLGVELHVRPFVTNRTFAGLYDRRKVARTAAGILAGIARRFADVLRLGAYDVVFVQREAALLGPPLAEWLSQRRLPLVLDLDDSTYIERRSEVFGAFAAALKWRGKTNQMLRWSDHVVCGNPTIAAYAERMGLPTSVLPTIVSVDRFTPRTAAPGAGEDVPVLGWIGTHSTFPYLRTLFPVFRRLAEVHRFRLRIIGAGAERVEVEGVEVESLPWKLDSEIADLQSFDAAVYPLIVEEFSEGKSGFKAIQYLSCGIPYVVTPIGIVTQLGVPGTTHLEARTDDEWFHALSRLLSGAALRREMGAKGRAYAVEHFSTRRTAEELARVFRAVVEKKQEKKKAAR